MSAARTGRSRPEQIRDLIMLLTLGIWTTFAVAVVVRIFLDGSKVLESLPPVWFWGIPLAPFTALYAPWTALRPSQPPVPEPPEPISPGAAT